MATLRRSQTLNVLHIPMRHHRNPLHHGHPHPPPFRALSTSQSRHRNAGPRQGDTSSDPLLNAPTGIQQSTASLVREQRAKDDLPPLDLGLMPYTMLSARSVGKTFINPLQLRSNALASDTPPPSAETSQSLPAATKALYAPAAQEKKSLSYLPPFLRPSWSRYRQNRPYFLRLLLNSLGSRWSMWTYALLTKPRLQLQSRADTLNTALLLYTRYHTALAAGDLPAIREICHPGLIADSMARLKARSSTTRFTWTLLRYGTQSKLDTRSRFRRILGSRFLLPSFFPPTQTPTLLSERGYITPAPPGADLTLPRGVRLGLAARMQQTRAAWGIRQACVLVPSIQTLTRYEGGLDNPLLYGGDEVGTAARGVPVEGTGAPREVEEIFVMQRKMENGKEGSWRIWGIIPRPETSGNSLELWGREGQTVKQARAAKRAAEQTAKGGEEQVVKGDRNVAQRQQASSAQEGQVVERDHGGVVSEIAERREERPLLFSLSDPRRKCKGGARRERRAKIASTA